MVARKREYSIWQQVDQLLTVKTEDSSTNDSIMIIMKKFQEVEVSRPNWDLLVD